MKDSWEFISLARQTMNAHGLEHWGLNWDRAKRRFGACHYGKVKKLTFSSFLFHKVDDADSRDTLLHEIAHALDYEERGTTDHGPNWKKWCRVVGANPVRCGGKEVDRTNMGYKWLLIDVRDRRVIREYHRKPRKDFSRSYLPNDPSSLGHLKVIPA